MMALWLSLAHANDSIHIQDDLRSTYLHKQPIVITFQIKNTTDAIQSIPNLAQQTWRTTFTIANPQKKETWSNEKKALPSIWTLAPKDQRQVRLEIPNSDRLAIGTYDLTIAIDYDVHTYVHQQSISILPPKQKHLTLIRQISGSIASLWTDEATKATYYNRGSEQLYLHPGYGRSNIVHHQGQAIYTYAIKDNTLVIQGKRDLRVPIPYPRAKIAAPVSYHKNAYTVPLWHPPSRMLYLMKINSRGIPSFRIIRSEMPTLQHADIAFSAEGTPFYIIQHNKGVELIIADIPQQHAGAINSQYILKQATTERVLDSRFGIHPQAGLAISITYIDAEQPYHAWYNLHGALLEKSAVDLKKETFIDMYPEQKSYLFSHDSSLLLSSPNTTQKIEKPSHVSADECRLHKKGVACFSNGEWIILHTHTPAAK